jgi:uncharacterized protein (TIGR03000 family)
MILGMEIAMLGMGLYALVTGKMTLTRNRVVYGAGARFLGLIALMPFPLAFLGGVVVGVEAAMSGRRLSDSSVQWTLIAIEGGAVVFCALLVYGLGMLMTCTPRRPAHYRKAERDVFSGCLPCRPGNPTAAVDSIQGAIPLSTMAYVRCQSPRRVDEVERPAAPNRGRGLWIAVMLLLYFVVQQAQRSAWTGDLAPAEAGGVQAAAAGGPAKMPPGMAAAMPANVAPQPLRTNDNSAAIQVRVPPDAKLIFNGKETSQTGSQRYFATPPLEPGKTFTYEVEATWQDANGKQVRRTREVHVQANQLAMVNFMDNQDQNSDLNQNRNQDRKRD